MTTSAWSQAVAKEIGSKQVDLINGREVQTLNILCTNGHTAEYEVRSRLPPNVVAKRMRTQGWTIGRKAYCRDCTARDRERRQAIFAQKPTVKPKPEKPPMKAETAAATSPAAGKAKRLVYMALEDYYQEADKRYKPGHSDATIAKDCGISEAAVKSIREESYGPLAAPDAIGELNLDLLAIETQAKAATGAILDSIAALKTRIDGLIKKNGWAE